MVRGWRDGRKGGCRTFLWKGARGKGWFGVLGVYAFGWSCGGRPRGPMSGGAFMLYLFTVPSLLVFSFSSPIFMLYS